METEEGLTPDMLQDDVLVIRIAQQSDVGQLSASELYNRTRGYWRNSKDYCSAARYALAVQQGKVQEVYRIAGWFNAGETFNPDLEPVTSATEDRIEFVGNIAPAPIRQRYLGKHLVNFFQQGDQNPVRFFPSQTH